ncbi:MAG TPA: hypothetical protein VHO25_20105 [Polyangiaceae bacterium]|nr:hypothetical protein [Polyangiaceae bacterium]
MNLSRPVLAGVFAAWLVCCAGSQRGPAQPEPPRTADDQVVGADNVPPSDKLKQGVRVSNQGVQPAAGWTLDSSGLHRDREEHTNHGQLPIDGGLGQ